MGSGCMRTRVKKTSKHHSLTPTQTGVCPPVSTLHSLPAFSLKMTAPETDVFKQLSKLKSMGKA